MKHEIDILHYLNIYKKEWKKMAFLIVIAIVITAMVQNMLPKTYRSTLIALSFGGAGSQAGGIQKFASLLNFSGISSSNDVIFAILKSRRMRKDIREHFSLKDKPKFWWNLDTYKVTGGFAVEVEGSDPEMTREIADFAVKNLKELNTELWISPEQVEIKVLDPAERGVVARRDVSKKAMTSSLIVFLVYTLFIFFREYILHLRGFKK